MWWSPAALPAVQGSLRSSASSLALMGCIPHPHHLCCCFRRPCKGVAKAYEKLAETYTDAVFLKLYGNANPACKALFKQFKIRSTPSFLYFRHGGWWRAAASSGSSQQPAAAGFGTGMVGFCVVLGLHVFGSSGIHRLSGGAGELRQGISTVLVQGRHASPACVTHASLCLTPVMVWCGGCRRAAGRQHRCQQGAAGVHPACSADASRAGGQGLPVPLRYPGSDGMKQRRQQAVPCSRLR